MLYKWSEKDKSIAVIKLHLDITRCAYGKRPTRGYVQEMLFLGEQDNISDQEVRHYIGRDIPENLQLRVVLLAAKAHMDFMEMQES